MRITYIDESGTNRNDPCMVVAGVVIDGDKQMGPIEDELVALVHRHIPAEDCESYFFHAADIWNGVGYFKGKGDLWPEKRRHAILDDLIKLPGKFGLPIVFGFIRRSEYLQDLPRAATHEELRAAIHVHAFIQMGQRLERAFRAAWPNENTLLIAEDIQGMKNILREAQAVLRSPAKLREWNIPMDELPLRHIRDTVHFAAKQDSRLLQLADACAYFIRGFLSGNPRHQPYHDELVPQMVAYPKAEMVHHDRAMKLASLSRVFQPWSS